MKNIVIKKSAVIFIFVSLFACALVCSAGSLFASDTAASSDIRTPDTDTENFWNQFDWDELLPAEQAAFAVLGWDKESWNEDITSSVSGNKIWAELNDDQRDAAEKLGYNPDSWDAAINK